MACAWVLCAGGVAGIYTVGTVPEAHGRGFGTAVTEAVRHAQGLGYRSAVLWASPAGRPVYERMGFRVFGALTVYQWAPAAKTLPSSR